ncbi:MAG TPA: response regulator, partial [Sphingomicrobium sp.]
ITCDPRYGQNLPHHGMPTNHLPVRSYLAVPVISRSGEVIGGLFFGHPQPDVFGEDTERLMLGIAGQAAIAIDNARLFEATQRANQTLEQRVVERTAELETAHEALRQAQKMEAVGQLTGGLAHDFNNLLTGVIGSLDMMERQIAKGDTSKVERYAKTAMTSANRAAALTHRLLAFSRRQPLDPKPVNANRLVSGMEELIRRTLGAAITLEVVTAGGLWQTLCDPHQLESAILNLTINARDAMPDGGMLTVETCNAHLDSAYAARDLDIRRGQYVCICVTDTGMGMSKDTIAKAFEPFFTTKPIGQGTGLGLSMIYGFARQSEGYARIYSELNVGTTIKIYLPRYYGEAEATEGEHGEITDAHRAAVGETVLVIEDESAVRELVVDVLEELGYLAVQAADGPAGLKLLQSAMRIDLLVTDIGLPGLNGRQVVDAAREQRPDLKVLFMTGYAENATIANGFLDPGMEMITKPFAIEALATRIRDMIER